MIKRVSPLGSYREQMMVEYLYKSWMEKHFGVANRNSYINRRVDLDGVTPLQVTGID